MQLSRDAGSLVYTRFQGDRELSLHLPNAEPIYDPQQEQKRDRTSRAEPGGLIIRRKHQKIRRDSSLIPQTVVIACNYAKMIVPGSKVVIKGLPPGPCFLLAGIMTLKHVAKYNLLGCREAERGIVNFEIARQRREDARTSQRGWASPSGR